MNDMTAPVMYTLYIDNEKHYINIAPEIRIAPGGNLHSTGVYRLSEGETDMGDIVFDDLMKQWEYTGMGSLTHKEAGQIADYIRNYIHH